MPAAVMVVVLTGVTLVLAWSRNALWLPRDDDWSYINAVFEWAESGQLTLNGWVHMMFVSLGALGVFASSVVGPLIWSLGLLTLFFGAVGLCSLFWLARKLLPAGLSLLALVIAGLSPLFLHLSVTFMTDIPAWALSAASLGLGTMAITRRRPAMLALGAGLALLGFGVREYALIPFLALTQWIALSKSPRSLRLWAMAVGATTAAVGFVAYSWRQSLPGSVETVVSTPLASLALYSRLLLTLALLLAPYVALGIVFIWPRRAIAMGALRVHWLGAVMGIAVAAVILFLSALQLSGNVIHPYGSSWTSVGDGVRSWPLWGYKAVTLAGALSLVLLLVVVGVLTQKRIAARLWRVIDRPQATSSFAGLYVFISVTVMAVYFAAIFVAGAPAFDRYLLLVVPLLGIVILWVAARSMNGRPSIWQKSMIAGILAVTGAFGVVITDGLNQVDGLRWQVASELVSQGIPAYKIDGGDAWFRFHQKDAPGVAQVGSLDNSIPGRTWWQTFFEGSTFCRMVAIESETDLQAMYGPAMSIQEERTLLGTPFRMMVFPGPDPC